MLPYESLAGRTIVLEPLAHRHTPDLIEAALRGQSMFEQHRTVHLANEREVRGWVRDSIALARTSPSTALPFAVMDVSTGCAVGSTWYINISERHRRCEIAWTWFSPRFREALIGLEARFLLLENAFEVGHMDRVEFRIDTLDLRSARVLKRLGADREGVLRNDFVDREGQGHDTSLYAVTRDEWPRIRASVELRIGGEIGEADRAQAVARFAAAVARRHQFQSVESQLPLPRGT